MRIDPLSLIRRRLTRKRQRGFLRDEKGVTAIEFGLLAIPFFSILGAILETSLVFLSGQLLDTAVQDASRFIRTGQMQSAGFDIAKFRSNVCGRLYGLFNNCENKLFVDVRPMGNFSAVSMQPPVNPSCTSLDTAVCPEWTRDATFQPGQGGSVMVVQVYYKWPVILNFGGFNLANLPNGARLMGAAAVFRNEPFT